MGRAQSLRRIRELPEADFERGSREDFPGFVVYSQLLYETVS